MLKRIMDKNKFTLLVSLPRNDLDLAKSALNAGADGIKVHLNVHHFASGQDYGNLEEQRDFFESLSKLKEETDCLIGIVPGEGEKYCSEEDFKELKDMGVDFISSYVESLPANMVFDKKFDVCGAISAVSDITVEEMNLVDIDVLEASVVNQKDYRTRLSLYDLAKYSSISKMSEKPVLIPTQKRIEPNEIELLYKAGCKGIMLGAVVFDSTDKEQLYKRVKEYREVIDNL